MIPKSIKWRLQIWYGLILVAVLIGFGATAYQLERNRQFRRIDDELHRRIEILTHALHPPPLRGPNRPRDQMPEDMREHGREFRLPPEAEGLFGPDEPHKFYYVIQSRGGLELARSAEAPTLLDLYLTFSGSNRPLEAQPEPPFNSPKPPTLETLLGFREMVQFLPPGEAVLVGCSIAPELKELRLAAINLTGVGCMILLVGLAGGWWFVSRALRPIENISAAAVKISAGDLSQRINVAETESELGKLASVLNSTFARLDAAFVQQKQFASDAAHELRTPVSVILTQTQTTLNRERSPGEYRETVEACQRAAQRMRRLIESLLELARFDAGQEVLKRLPFDFSKIISDCTELVKPLADERSVKILPELAPLEITGDSERLAQVVTNLLTNAIQFNRAGGEVRVKLAAQNGMAVLAISDTGPGISAEDLPHIFERFYRGDKSRTGGPPGLRIGAAGSNGLGLAIAKVIVEAHGGTIEVSSQEKVGTTFTVCLPV